MFTEEEEITQQMIPIISSQRHFQCSGQFIRAGDYVKGEFFQLREIDYGDSKMSFAAPITTAFDQSR